MLCSHRSLQAFLGVCLLLLSTISLASAGVVVYLDGSGGLRAVSRPDAVDPFTAVQALSDPPQDPATGEQLRSAIPSTARVLSLDDSGDTFTVDFSKEIIAGLDEERLASIFKQVRFTLEQFDPTKDVRLLAEGILLSDYLPPAPVVTRDSRAALSSVGGVESQTPEILGSLSGKSITLSPGHGLYWNGSGWYTARPVYCSPLNQEDYHNLEMCQYLETYLLNDGMTVKMVRCTDKDYGNHSSGNPWWKMGASYWLQYRGYPCSVYASSTGDCTLGSGASESNDDIRARPLASDYDGTDIYVSIHTNGYTGDCTGSCPTGTDTYYDCSTEHASWCTVSQNLANAVHGALIDTIRTKVPVSDWYDRGKHDSNGAYGEIRIPDRAAILIELAFHDTCDRDAIYLRDNFFRSAAMWGIYKGICNYFGTTPTWDFYSDELVSHDLPTSMAPGETRTVHITFRNKGVLWTEAKQIRLGAVGDSDPFTAATRQYISGEVGPNETYTFTFNLTAPTTPGVYTTDWRMVRDGVTWFGATASSNVTVSGTQDTEPPSVPQNLVATSPNMSQIDLTWSPSTDNVGVSGYKIYRNGVYLTSVGGTSYSNTGLSQNTTYTYTVSAYDGSGNESAQSAPSTATTWALIFQDGFPDLANWIADTVADGTVRGLTYDGTYNHATYTGAGSATATAGATGTNGCLSYRPLGGQFTSGRLEGYFYDSSANNSSRQGVWLRCYNGSTYAGGIYLGTYSSSPGSYGTYSGGVFNGSAWVWNGQIQARSIGWHQFRIDVLPSGSGAIKFFIDGSEKASQDRFANLNSYGLSRANIGHNYNVNQQGWFDDIRFSVPVPKAPTMTTPAAQSTSSIRWNFTDNSDCEFSFSLQDNSHAQKATAGANSSSVTETGLVANTQYTRHIHAKNGTIEGPASNSVSRYTLSVPPSASTVVCSRSASSWYATPNFTFTAVGGFGAGRVQYYRYAWDQSPTHTWTGSEAVWNSGDLTLTAAADGGWYLHVMGYNGDDVSNGSLDLGPYLYKAPHGTIAEAKGLEDGQPVSLQDKIVTAKFDGFFYIEESDRSSGIRVVAPISGAGVLATVSGVMDTTGGEREIASANVSMGGPADIPPPIALKGNSVGGASLNAYTGGVVGGVGTNNIGLLVTVFGRITHSEDTFAYVDDGSGYQDGSGYMGVRILKTGLTNPLEEGKFAVVTGISSTCQVGSSVAPMIRPRSDADVITYSIP